MLAGWGGGHVDRKVRRVDRRVLRDVSRRQRDDATPSTPPHIPSLWLRRCLPIFFVDTAKVRRVSFEPGSVFSKHPCRQPIRELFLSNTHTHTHTHTHAHTPCRQPPIGWLRSPGGPNSAADLWWATPPGGPENRGDREHPRLTERLSLSRVAALRSVVIPIAPC